MSEVSETPLRLGLFTNPNSPFTFTFQGRPIHALAGQSIAAALYAAGVRIFTRSFKYHRPRGLFCVSGECPNCLMEVDGRPNVRTCMEPAQPGQVVRSQNAWPTLNFDVLRIVDHLDWFLPVGFYYKRFHKPKWFWPLLEPVIRRLAGLGRIDVSRVPQAQTDLEHHQVDVCVVGGGPAGLAAALAAADAQASVLLLERLPRPGGHLLYEPPGFVDREPLDKVVSHPGVQVRCNTTVFGLYEGNLLAAFQGDRLLKIRARQVIIATGARQRPLLFQNNDLPGIFLSRGILRLARLHGVQAGQRAVVVSDSADGLLHARALQSLGIEIAALVRSCGPAVAPRSPDSSSLPTIHGVVCAAHGRHRLKAISIARADSPGKSPYRIDCDVLALASNLVPANELLHQGGMRFDYQGGNWRPLCNVPGLHAAGGAAGTFALAAQELEGRLRGAEAAASLGYAVDSLPDYRREWEAMSSSILADAQAAIPNSQPTPRKSFVCLCEDVSAKDLYQAIGEGFDGIETLKRYSTATMGVCQGKMCTQNVRAICAQATGRDLDTVGTPTSRPPVVPVELCVLAAGQQHRIRRTPMHHWHEAAGARWMDAGLWKRPESYGDAVTEVRAVRTAAGLIDVSTLGKIELIGRDAVRLLERIYLNRWADLKVGRVRYGVMCTEEGILFDDGVAARRGPDHYYLTATTGNAESVWQWLAMWQATWGMDVTVVNQTAAVAAMNLAGPKAREVLGRLTHVDLSPGAFPYLALREGTVAGVPCLLFRIGFVGELGYEIHCPAALAGYLWEALAEAGKDFGLSPFGVEAQRLLRLEKGHLIIGVDTDALSNPLEAGLDWLVHFDKPSFLGREPLLRLKARGPRSRLVGFRLLAATHLPEDLRDLEGCQVVQAGKPVGRVTSARHSPTLGYSLGLAWVPVARAEPGQGFQIRCQERDLDAEVVPLPFYDPQMHRQKG